VKKLLIIGDSFSENMCNHSWVTQLGYSITNLSDCGIGEYKIYQKINSIKFSDFSLFVVSHTSPNRIYIENNPLYKDNPRYQNCDLLYADVKSKEPNCFASKISWWYENVFDIDHAEFMHNLLVNYIIDIMPQSTIHLTFFNTHNSKLLNYNEIWKKNPGDINHLNMQGNIEVANRVKKILRDREQISTLKD